jgi:hypothetical protein
VVRPEVATRLRGVEASNSLFRSLGRARANQPESKKAVRHSAMLKTEQILGEQIDTQVDKVVEDLRDRFAGAAQDLAQFRNLTLPLVREGAMPRFAGARSSPTEIVLGAIAANRSQWGAPAPCPVEIAEADVSIRIHVSFFNNMLETILGGKRLSDEFLMRYAKIMQAELPLNLMVHSRTPRWALEAASVRPLEIAVTEPNCFRFTFRTRGIHIDGVEHPYPSEATVEYRLLREDDGYAWLQRLGPLRLDSELPTPARIFLEAKLSAFFGEILDGGGVVVPDGALEAANGLVESIEFRADREWLVLGLKVSQEAVRKLIDVQIEPQAAPPTL